MSLKENVALQDAEDGIIECNAAYLEIGLDDNLNQQDWMTFCLH